MDMTNAPRAHNPALPMSEKSESVIAPTEQQAPAGALGLGTGSELEAALTEKERDYFQGLFPQAVAVILSTRRASTSMIQRRLRLGYNRSWAMLCAMERMGIVGPENGSTPREILVPNVADQPRPANGESSTHE